VEEMLAEIAELYPRYHVRETVSAREIEGWTREMTLPFQIVGLLVLFMSVFIIFTSFRVIVVERLPVIGTFRSVGATGSQTSLLLLGESALYGIIGGPPGVLLGLALLKLLIRFSAGEWLSAANTGLVVTPAQVVSSLVLSLVLAAGSAVLPILQARKLPLRDVILNTVEHHATWKPRRIWIGALVCAAALTIPWVLPFQMLTVVGSASIFLLIGGLVAMLPWLVRSLLRIAAAINRRVFGNLGYLATRNLKDNPGALNNIALLTIGITGLFMIGVLSQSVALTLTRFYDSAQFEIWFWANNARRWEQTRLMGVPGVRETFGVYELSNVQLEGGEDRIGLIQAAPGAELARWWGVPFSDDPEYLFDRLEDGRNIIVTPSLAYRLNVGVGDTLPLLLRDRVRQYRVIGMVYTIFNNGSYGLIAPRWFKLDTGQTTYGDIYVRTPEEPGQTVEQIEERYRRRWYWIDTVAHMKERELEQTMQVFRMLQLFSVLALLIGSVGILNNYVLSFLERRRVLAVIRSVGMSRMQTRHLLLIEALTAGAAGSVLGLVGGLGVLSFIPRYVEAFGLVVQVEMKPLWMIGVAILGALLSILAALIPSRHAGGQSLVESLQYE
jgi:putative ABC transport system permease protein